MILGYALCFIVGAVVMFFLRQLVVKEVREAEDFAQRKYSGFTQHVHMGRADAVSDLAAVRRVVEKNVDMVRSDLGSEISGAPKSVLVVPPNSTVQAVAQAAAAPAEPKK
ncbi:MAG TPA: hypothetical protein VFB79_21615 [Candidatus Angelobacter sp.]|nr:hypothetical protein [Candidatus Angelobacter sp.]